MRHNVSHLTIREIIMTEQELIAIAKAPAVAYSNKEWEAMRASVAAGFLYDEIATQRKTQGVDEAIELWRGWATAFPDSKATFENAWAGSGGVALLRGRESPWGAVVDAGADRL